jgi:hypothetical protein
MNSRTFTYLFLGLGILFALLSIYLSLRPVSIRELYRCDSLYGIISMGFIPGVCLFVSGMLVKKFPD